MISFSRIGKQYGRQVLFVDAGFQLNPGEKVGLVGPNGSGKTTLFRMIVGEESADEGEVSVPKKLTVGYFRQDVEEMAGRSVLDEAIAGSGRVDDLHHELEEITAPDRALRGRATPGLRGGLPYGIFCKPVALNGWQTSYPPRNDYFHGFFLLAPELLHLALEVREMADTLTMPRKAM